MKVLLVRPKPHPDTIGLQSIMVCEPLELEYLAAVIKGCHQVELVDMILEKDSLEHFLVRYRPDVVAITAYISHVPVVKEYAGEIKEFDAAVTVVVGGVHAEVVPEDFSDENIDYVVYAKGLANFTSLLEHLEAGSRVSLPGVLNQGRQKVAVANRDLPTVFPDRTITAKYRDRYYYMYHQPCALLKTSYGCPFTCNFCFCREITGGSYYVRDLEEVIAEILQIKEREIYIVDDNFLVDPVRVERFCELLKKHRLDKRFLIYGRADFIAEHEETVAKFVQVGLRAVIVGVESPDSNELAQYNKQSSVEINERAIAILHKYNVDCYATMIMGLDWKERDFDRLYRWLSKNELQFVNLQPLTPMPGTILQGQYTDLLIERTDYAKWDLANLVVKPTGLSVRSYYFHILKVYFKITLSPRSLFKNLRYGLLPNLKLSLGVTKITWQYLQKVIKG